MDERSLIVMEVVMFSRQFGCVVWGSDQRVIKAMEIGVSLFAREKNIEGEKQGAQEEAMKN